MSTARGAIQVNPELTITGAMTSAASAERPVQEQPPPAGRARLAELGCDVVGDAPGSYVVATLGPVVIVCLGRDAGAAGQDAFSLANAQAARRYPKLAHLVLFSVGCTLPSAEERQAVVEVLRSFRDQIAAASVVLEGGGLATVLLRSVVRVVDRINRSAHPTRVFAAPSDAARWIVQTLGADAAPPAERLQAALLELRRFLEH